MDDLSNQEADVAVEPADDEMLDYDASELFDGGTSEPQDDASRFDKIRFGFDDRERPAPLLDDAIRSLRENRILIFGGDLPEKRMLARRCAWELSTLLEDEDQNGKMIPAMELRGLVVDLDFFDDAKPNSVIVLASVDPFRINRHLELLRRQAAGGYWIVIATDRTRSAWQLSGEFERYWYEGEETALYAVGDLTVYLSNRLEAKALDQKAGRHFESHAIEKCAADLGYPAAIDTFVDLLATLDPDAPVDLDAFVRKASRQNEAVQHWFQHRLDGREKVVALALTLFDGLEEDVAFDSIEYLLDGAWRKRDATLRFIDYGDLVNIRRFFSVGDEAISGTVYCQGEDVRQAILETAWKTHRRQIVAALPVLTVLVKASIEGKPMSLRVGQRRQLRHVIGNTLGALAVISLEVVESQLLNLIATGHPADHRTVAIALRRMRKGGPTEELFALLNRWRSGSEFYNAIEHLVGKDRESRVPALVGSALVTVIAELAAEDPIDTIDERIVDFLLSYAASDDRSIQRRLAYEAVPRLVIRHTDQMMGLFHELSIRIGNGFSRNYHYTRGFALGLGQLGLVADATRAKIITDWIDEGIADQEAIHDPDAVSIREQKLSIAGIALGFARSFHADRSAPPDIECTLISPGSALHQLNRILTNERHRFVRNAACQAAEMLLKREFDSVRKEVGSTIGVLSLAERASFTEMLVDLHCLQRSMQKNGDSMIKIEGPRHTYLCPIWYEHEPENTAVQDMVFQWLETGGEEQLAAFAGAVVREVRAIIERTQEKAASDLRGQRERDIVAREKMNERERPRIARHTSRLTFLQRVLTVPVATLGRSDIRSEVAGMLDSLQQYDQGERNDVLERLHKEGESKGGRESPKGGRLHAIADRTERAIQLGDRIGVILVVLVSLVVGLLFLVSGG